MKRIERPLYGLDDDDRQLLSAAWEIGCALPIDKDNLATLLSIATTATSIEVTRLERVEKVLDQMRPHLTDTAGRHLPAPVNLMRMAQRDVIDACLDLVRQR